MSAAKKNSKRLKDEKEIIGLQSAIGLTFQSARTNRSDPIGIQFPLKTTSISSYTFIIR